MNYTITNMFAPLTLASDDEMRAARRAGWRRADLTWERLSEAANLALTNGDHRKAIRGFRRAFMLARLCFAKSDPRYATSLANAGVADRLSGRSEQARRKLNNAAGLWAKVPDTLEDIQISPRARSSLFHLRMEARHWDTYCDNTRIRLGKFIAESDEALSHMADGTTPTHRLFSRWRGEKPNVFDDTRKYLSAALLLAGEQTA